jgi:hypothetical protein
MRLFFLLFFLSILEAYSQATCTFYFIQNNTDTPAIDLSRLKISAGTNVTGMYLKSGKGTSINNFIHASDSSIENAIRTGINAKFNYNLDTNALVLLDMEYPVPLKSLIDSIPDSLLRDSVIKYGFKRRIEIARKVLPNAYLGLYGVVVPSGQGSISSTQLRGLLLAKQIGMFDSLDFICPVLYPRWQGSHDKDNAFIKGAKSIHTSMEYAFDSLKCGKDIIPLLSMIIANSNSDFDNHWLDAARAKQYVDSLQKFPQVSAIAYWMGQPYDPVTNQLQWQSRRDSIKSYLSDSLLLLPVAQFGYKQNNKQFNFTDSSFNANSWFWNFGDGYLASLKNPSHTYLTNGTYTISCIVANNGSCPDTCTKIVLVKTVGLSMQEHFNVPKIWVQPNPASEFIIVKFDNYNSHNGYEICLFNIIGELQKKKPLIADESIFSTEELSKGVYVLAVTLEGEIVDKQKIIIQ